MLHYKYEVNSTVLSYDFITRVKPGPSASLSLIKSIDITSLPHYHHHHQCSFIIITFKHHSLHYLKSFIHT